MTKRRKLYEEKRRNRLNRPGRWVKEPVGLTEYQRELLFGRDEKKFELRLPIILKAKESIMDWVKEVKKKLLDRSNAIVEKIDRE